MKLEIHKVLSGGSVWSTVNYLFLKIQVFLIITASIYVVRKIRAAIADGEQVEKPIITPCSAVGKDAKLTISTDYEGCWKFD